MSNYITYEERMEIENCLYNGKSFGQIAKGLGKDRSTISREIRKPSIVKWNAILVCLIYIFEYINYNYERVLHFVLQKIINANALILFGKRKK